MALGSLCMEAKDAYRGGGLSARSVQMFCRIGYTQTEAPATPRRPLAKMLLT